LEVAMNWVHIKGHWTELEGRILSTWGRLTHDDLAAADGQVELLVGRLMVRYGLSKEDAVRRVEDWAASLEEAEILVAVFREREQQEQREREQQNLDAAAPRPDRPAEDHPKQGSNGAQTKAGARFTRH
jgi:uncharacterized protein YjbJ (UPF0337 family)